MARRHESLFAGKWAAQEARRDARAGDFEYATGNTRSKPDGATREDAQRPKAGDERTRPAPIYPLVSLCRAMRLAEPVPEHPVCDYRRWRFDYAWPLHMLALEIEGGIWTQGRHTRGSGAIADLEKYSEAAILGWRVIYCTPDDLMTLGLDRVRRALSVRA